MRRLTYARILSQISSGAEHLDSVATVGAERIIARMGKPKRRSAK